MNKKIFFYNDLKSHDEFDVSNLVLNSLELLKVFYEETEKKEDLVYKNGESFNYQNVFLTLSNKWINNKVNDFYLLLQGQIDIIEIEESEFDLLKYYVDFFWYNSENAELMFGTNIYKLFNQKFRENENTIHNLKLI